MIRGKMIETLKVKKRDNFLERQKPREDVLRNDAKESLNRSKERLKEPIGRNAAPVHLESVLIT